MACLVVHLAFFLSLVAVAPVSPSPVCMTTGPLSFCGGKVGSPTCCTTEDDAKLHRAFVDELKKHDYYHDPLCLSNLKAVICAVCLSSAPAPAPAEPFSNASKSNELSLPLRCAAPSVSIHDLTTPSTETPTPEWPPADDDNNASTTTKLVIGVIVSVLTLLGGFITYKICTAKLCNNNQCFNNNQCCNNIVCVL